MMGKHTKSRKAAESVIGKGKVTPVQVAFIVDRYLSDNNFPSTRSTFRKEASHLISKSPVNEAPKSLLSLGDMLDEYIRLKEHKVIFNQEKTRFEQEKLRVQTLLRGMQHVINAYSCTHTHPPPTLLPSPLAPSPPNPPPNPNPNPNPPPPPSVMHNTPANNMSLSRPSSSLSEPPAHFSTTSQQPTLKRRKNSKDAPLLAPSKRTRTQPSLTSSASAKPPTITPNNQQRQITPLPSDNVPLPVQGSTVAKCLFNTGPQTPSPSPGVSPADDNRTPPSTNKNTLTPQQFTSTNRTVITSETIQVSPMKQVSYYSIQRDHCITSPMKTSSKRFSTRDHVKGRLDFDASEMVADMLTSDGNTESPSEDDAAFDFDLPNLDCLGADFNLTDLLGDFDLGGEQIDYFCQPDNGSSPESLSGSPDAMVDDRAGDHELVSGMSSTVTEIRSEQDMNVAGAGPNSVTSVKSVTKCIKVISPVKTRSC